MDPPEFRTSRSRANPLGLRPESDARARSVKIWAGPSRRPSGISALTFGRAKITLNGSRATLHSNGGWEQTTGLSWPGGSRGSGSELKMSHGQLSPTNRPARNSGSRPKTRSGATGQIQVSASPASEALPLRPDLGRSIRAYRRKIVSIDSDKLAGETFPAP